MAYQNTNIATSASNLRAVIGQNPHKVQVTNMIAAANKTNPTYISTKYTWSKHQYHQSFAAHETG
jgi:hypothetical protein